MMFSVSLIRVPDCLTEAQLEELGDNARHVEGRWWIFEGETEFLSMPVRVFASGVTTGLHPDDVPPGAPIIAHAVSIFDLGTWPPSF